MVSLGEMKSPPCNLKSLKPCPSFQSTLSLTFLPSFGLSFHHLYALLTNSFTLFHNPFQSETLFEVGMWWLVQWINSHTSKNLKTVTPRNLAGERRRRRTRTNTHWWPQSRSLVLAWRSKHRVQESSLTVTCISKFSFCCLKQCHIHHIILLQQPCWCQLYHIALQ